MISTMMANCWWYSFKWHTTEQKRACPRTIQTKLLASIYWKNENDSQEICPQAARNEIKQPKLSTPFQQFQVQRHVQRRILHLYSRSHMDVCRCSPNNTRLPGNLFPRADLQIFLICSRNVSAINPEILIRCKFCFNRSGAATRIPHI
jgi:hypothetical protein